MKSYMSMKSNMVTLIGKEPVGRKKARSLRLPQVFYNQGLSSLRRSVSYVRAEH